MYRSPHEVASQKIRGLVSMNFPHCRLCDSPTILAAASIGFYTFTLNEVAMDSLSELLEDELKDIFNAENQLVKALPKLAKKASSPKLQKAFTDHLKQTEGHVERLRKIGEILDIKLTGKKCHAMEGLVEEGKEVLEEDGEGAVIDAALIGAAQRVEHYEMAAYGTVRAIAEQLGHANVVKLLQATLDEEGAADKLLTQIAESEVLPEAGSESEAVAQEK
jgi:ferritin-like metal-binding protein YciE